MQLAAQLFAFVTTNGELQEVHVVVLEAQVKQEGLQGCQFVPVLMVFPTSQVSTQVFVLRSNLLLVTHEVHVEVVPVHVLQLVSQGKHVSVAKL